MKTRRFADDSIRSCPGMGHSVILLQRSSRIHAAQAFRPAPAVAGPTSSRPTARIALDFGPSVSQQVKIKNLSRTIESRLKSLRYRRRARMERLALWGTGFWLLLLAGTLCCQEPQPINCGQTVTGSLGSAGRVNSYTFSANAGGSITLLMLSQSLNPVADVFNPAGARIGGATNNFTGPLVLATTGTYTVRVHAANGASKGAYGLSLTFLTGRCGPALVWGPSTAGTVAVVAEVDSYTFSGNDGEAVSLNISSTNMTAAAFVASPSGVILANWVNGTSSISLAQTGTYTVGIYPFYVGGTGSYYASLVFTRLTPASFRLAIGTTNGARELTLWGQVGRPTTLQFSSDLGRATWSPLTNFSLPWSPYRFVDGSSFNLPVRFYRTIQ